MALQPFPALVLSDRLEAAADRILKSSGSTPSFRSAVMWA
jgi:hypothetical protein